MKAVLTEIISDNRYKSICRQVATSKHLADDLYQEFILSILETEQSKLSAAKDGGYLEVFCVGVINNIWGKRNRAKSYVVGKTSPLFEYCNTIEVDDVNRFIKPSDGYNIRYDYVSKEIEKHIKEQMNSTDKDTMYNSRVFYYSNFTYKNPMQFSKKSKIPYQAVIATCRKYRKYLEDKFINKLIPND